MDHQSLLPLFSNNELATNFFKQKNLLKNSSLCTACQTTQNWTKYQKPRMDLAGDAKIGRVVDLLTTSIRKDSFF